MVDSADLKKDNTINTFLLNDEINRKVLSDLQINGKLSDAEIRFLSLSREKSDSSQAVNKIINSEITLNNYEEVLYLRDYQPIGGTVNPEQSVRNIRYRDRKGTIVAIVQIDKINKKIRMQNFGDILPKQEVFSPEQVALKLKNMALYNKWIIEDGGVNQFNGNLEYRYKDLNGKVMSAIITKPNGVYDMIVEYSYVNGNKSQMLLTNQYGQSIVVYDGAENGVQKTRIDIDGDGLIVEITKIYN